MIADECHRGYTTAKVSLWRDVLEYFDAIKIGLTATPAAHTKAYFNNVVYRYEYAVREGYLVDYDAVKVRSNVRMQGLFLKQGELVGMVDPESGHRELDHLEDEREFDTTEVERTVTSPDSNRKILEEIKKHALEHERRYGRFPKTLTSRPTTARTRPMPTRLSPWRSRSSAAANRSSGKSPAAATGPGSPSASSQPGPAGRGRDGRSAFHRRRYPQTGIHRLPPPGKSRILFEQMLGRGTRKGDKFPDKSHFTVFDCFDGTLLAYFRNSTGLTADPPEKPARSIKEIIDAIWANHDRDYNVRCLVRRLQRIEKEMAGEARPLFAAFGIADGDVGRYAAALPGRLRADFTAAMRLLRDEDFQRLFVDYRGPSGSSSGPWRMKTPLPPKT